MSLRESSSLERERISPQQFEMKPFNLSTDQKEEEEKEQTKKIIKPGKLVENVKSTIILFLKLILVVVFYYFAVLAAFGSDSVGPGTSMFSLMIVVVLGIMGGHIASLVNLAPLVGMLLTGMIVRNIPALITPISVSFAGILRNFALTVIISRAGNGIKFSSFKKQVKLTLLLSFLPVFFEVLMNIFLITVLLNFPFSWSVMLAFGLAPMSPGVLVPLILILKGEKYGVKKGVCTTMIVASGLDATFAVVGFSLSLGINFSSDPILLKARVFIEIGSGLAIGCLAGFIAYLMHKFSLNSFYRTMLMMGISFFIMYEGRLLGYTGASTLSIIILWCCAANLWDPDSAMNVTLNLRILWNIAQPLLFSVIGAAVAFDAIPASTLWKTFIIIIFGIIARMSMIMLITINSELNLKERFFIGGAFTAKATAQAAFGYTIVDSVAKAGLDTPYTDYGNTCFLVMLFAVVFATPFSAIWINNLGRMLLTKDDEPQEAQLVSEEHIEPDGLGMTDFIQEKSSEKIQQS